VRERIAECRSRLNRGKRKFPNIIRLIETENTLDLVKIDVLLDFNDIGVQMMDVFNIRKDECFFWVKAESNNVLYIVDSHRHGAFWTFEL
jgi:hypothetical protein